VYVLVELPNGEQHTIPWSQISRVVAFTPTAAPTLTPAAPVAMAPSVSLRPLPEAPTANTDVAVAAPPAIETSAEAPKQSEWSRARASVFEVGLRTALGVPFGSAVKGSDFNDAVSLQAQLGLELGVRVRRAWFFGFAGTLGLGAVSSQVADACEALGHGCLSYSSSVGVLARLHTPVSERANMWGSVGIGFSDVAYNLPHTPGLPPPTRILLLGYDLLKVGVGADLRAGRSTWWGPYTELSMGAYTSARVPGSTKLEAIEKTALHYWLQIGVRFALSTAM
jgi:hypothetical protein